MTQTPLKQNTPPAYKLYPDKGCEFASLCQECPHNPPICEYPGGKKSWLVAQRNKRILDLFKKRQKTKEIALTLSVPIRTVRAVIGRYRKGVKTGVFV